MKRSSAGAEPAAAAGPGGSVRNVTSGAVGPSQEEGKRAEALSDNHSTGKKNSSAAGRSKHPSLLGTAFFGVGLRQLTDGVQQL